VEFECHKQKYEAKVRREVIVSGGPINSPQILELSGIGDPAILQDVGVDSTIENKGIGADFQDHVVVVGAYETTSEIPTLDRV
jgi:choline dehydrogenase-like flavoprotein